MSANASRRDRPSVAADGRFDSLAILAALNRQRVAYVLIGALARVIQAPTSSRAAST